MRISKSFIVSVLTALNGALTLGLLALPLFRVSRTHETAYAIMKLDGIESILACAVMSVAIAVTLIGTISAIFLFAKPEHKIEIKLNTLNIISSISVIVITFAAFLQLAFKYKMYTNNLLSLGTAYPTILLFDAMLTVGEI